MTFQLFTFECIFTFCSRHSTIKLFNVILHTKGCITNNLELFVFYGCLCLESHVDFYDSLHAYTKLCLRVAMIVYMVSTQIHYLSSVCMNGHACQSIISVYLSMYPYPCSKSPVVFVPRFNPWQSPESWSYLGQSHHQILPN